MVTRSLFTTSAAVLTALAPQAGAVVIDDFTDGNVVVTNSANGNVTSGKQGPLTGVVDNGFREVIIRNFAPNQGTGNSATVSSGAFAVVRGPGPDSADFQLIYTGSEFPGSTQWDYDGLADEDTLLLDFVTNTTSALQVSVQADPVRRRLHKLRANYPLFQLCDHDGRPIDRRGGPDASPTSAPSVPLTR